MSQSWRFEIERGLQTISCEVVLSFQRLEQRDSQVMNDHEMMEEEDKENIRPIQEESLFKLDTISSNIFNILPVNINRKRKRSSDMEEPSQGVKRINCASDRNQNRTLLQSILALPKILQKRLDRSDTEQQYEYLEYLNQRESFD